MNRQDLIPDFTLLVLFIICKHTLGFLGRKIRYEFCLERELHIADKF